jgi:single-strand DNA-binding protein
MNKVILLGWCGNDPEIKTFNQSKVAKFSLATNEYYKNKAGEKVTETTWHNLVYWGKSADLIESYVHKGDSILVEGKIAVRQYEKAGVNHWSTEIICNKIEFISKQEAKEPKQEPDARGKVHVDSMSDINDLPQHVRDAEDIPDEEIPFA